MKTRFIIGVLVFLGVLCGIQPAKTTLANTYIGRTASEVEFYRVAHIQIDLRTSSHFYPGIQEDLCRFIDERLKILFEENLPHEKIHKSGDTILNSSI